MTNNQHGQVPAIQRFEVVDCIDDKHVPAVIPKPHGPWVRYEDHIAALVEAQQPAPSDAVALSDDLRDRLVAISEAIADQDDRAAQAMLREILKAPQADSQPAPVRQWDTGYPPLPMQFACSGMFPVYSADQMRAFADATHALRASLGQASAGATPECLTCSDHGAVGNILTAEPCPDCTRLNAQPAPATQQAEVRPVTPYTCPKVPCAVAALACRADWLWARYIELSQRRSLPLLRESWRRAVATP